MKKLLILAVASILLFVAPAQASDNSIKLFGGLGLGLNNMKGLTMNLGGEMGVSEQISIGTEFSYYFSTGEAENLYAKVDSSLFTLSGYAKLDLGLSESMGTFVKAGLSYAKATVDFDTYLGSGSVSSSDVKLLAGVGIEIPMGEKLSVQTGLDLYFISGSWMKAYANICYRIK